MDRRGTRWIVVLVLLLLVAALLLLEPKLHRSPPRDGAAPASAPAAEATREPEHAAPETALREPVAVESEPAPTPEPRVEPPVPAGVEVLVVRAEDDAPVPDAEVLWIDWDALTAEQHKLVDGFTRELDRAMALAGRSFRTDAQGVTRVPQPLLGAQLVARTPGRYGLGFAHKGAKERAVVRLASDVELPVHVSERGGRAVAGVVVALRATDAHNRHDVARSTTDADGRATLAHVQAQRANAAGMQFSVGLTMLTREPLELPLEPEVLEHGVNTPIEIEIPDTGTVEVEILGEASELSPGWVQLETERSGADAGDPRPNAGVPSVALDPAQPVVRFERVGLGLSLVATFQTQHEEGIQLRAAGPRASGEVVRIRIDASGPAHRPMITGRVLDPRGAPLARTAVAVQLEVRRGIVRELSSTSFHTDDKGAFEMPLRNAIAPDAIATMRLTAGARGTRATLPAADSRGRISAGDLVLAELPILCAGRVVDERGEVLPGASIEVMHHLDPRATTFWDKLEGCDATSGKDGVFVIRSGVVEDDFTLHAELEDHVTVRGEAFHRGASDLEVVLARGAALAGRVRLPDGVEGEDVEMVLMPLHAFDPAFTARPRADGTFRFHSIPPGPATLAVHTQQETQEDESPIVIQLVLAAGEETRDPRLEPLDLSQTVHTFMLELVDENGTGLSGATVWSLHGEDWGSHHVMDDGNGVYRVIRSSPTVDVLVTASGYRKTQLQLTGDRKLVLVPGPPVEITVHGLSHELLDGYLWRVDLEPEEFRPGDDGSLTMEGAVAKGTVSATGRHRVRVAAGLAIEPEPGVVSRPSNWVGVDLVEALVADVRDTTEVQRFEVTIDPSSLPNAFAQLRKLREQNRR